MILTKTFSTGCVVAALALVCAIGSRVSAVIYAVDAAGTWFPSIQAAIDVCTNGDEVWLYPGTYTGTGNRNITYRGKAITVRSWTGNPKTCIIDCQGGAFRRGFLFNSGEGPGSVLEGVTIINGSMEAVEYPDTDCDCPQCDDLSAGGAILCWIGSPTIINCVFRSNTASSSGGAVALHCGSPTFTNCVFSHNAALYGGGMSCGYSASATFTNCKFYHNEADYGGGIYSYDADLTLTNCKFDFNYAAIEGGGVYTHTYYYPWSPPTVTNCLFVWNMARRGAGIYCSGSSPVLTDCTFSGNSGMFDGGGMYCGDTTNFPDVYGSFPVLTRCTFYNNAVGGSGGGMYFTVNSSATIDNTIISFGTAGSIFCETGITTVPTFTCCDIFGNSGGDWVPVIANQANTNGNISLDPKFCSAARGDFTLHTQSPCASYYNPACGQIGAKPVGCGSWRYIGSFRVMGGPNQLAQFDTEGMWTGEQFSQIAGAADDLWGYRDGASDKSYAYFGWGGGVARHNADGSGGALLFSNSSGLTTIRGLAYDPTGDNGSGSLWAVDLSSPLVELSMTGDVLQTFPDAGWWLYGLAYDDSDGHLWGHDLDGRVIKIDTDTGEIIQGVGWDSGFPGMATQGGLSGLHDGTGRLAAVSQGTPDELGVYESGGVLSGGPWDLEGQTGSDGHLGVAATGAIGPPVQQRPGDFDSDGDVDLEDHDALTLCLQGPDTGFVGSACTCFDFDADDDVDIRDFAEFQRVFGAVFFGPADDALIDAYVPGNNYGDWAEMRVRNGAQAIYEQNALLRFDLSSLTPGTSITTATLYVYYFGWIDNDPGGRELTCRRVMADWDETTVTWSTRPPSAPAITDVASVPAATGTWMAWDVTADVQSFLDGLETDYGWTIIDEVAWPFGNIPWPRLRSKEHAEFNPYLSIR